MGLDLMKERGVSLERQEFHWRDLVRIPISKLDDDAFTRVRIILMNGIEAESVRFQHTLARLRGDLRLQAARQRRLESCQQTLVNWMLPPDQSALETTIAYEQVAVEVTASVAQNEPDPYLAQVYRFGLLEDFDHLYRYAALLDRLEGKDANNILQSYTDILPGRPTVDEHRAPEDDVREPYDRNTAAFVSKLNAGTIMAAEQQTQVYYMNVGPQFADPVARQLYAEIAAIEEQHVTQYESLIDPEETLLEKWLIHEATEVYNYWSCYGQEKNPRVREIWERFLSYELGHFHFVLDLFRKHEKREAEAVIATSLPDPIDYTSHRQFVRDTLAREVDLRARGTQFIRAAEEAADSPSVVHRRQFNAQGSPSQNVAAGYQWQPGGELMGKAPAAVASGKGGAR